MRILTDISKTAIANNERHTINTLNRDVQKTSESTADRNKEKRVDSLHISNYVPDRLSSTSKGVQITKIDNSYNILFKNPAYAYRAVKHGYIDVGGVKLELSDKEKAEIRKTADIAFEQMQKDTLIATIEHNAHVLHQQAEAIASAGKEEFRLLEILLGNDDEKWVSPLEQLETHSVSMNVEKTQDGFVIRDISMQSYVFDAFEWN